MIINDESIHYQAICDAHNKNKSANNDKFRKLKHIKMRARANCQ